MPAMMEQAAMDQVCDAGGICVDANLKRIDVQVSVSLDPNNGKPVIAAPGSFTVWGVPTIPDDSTWEVTWTINGPSSVAFCEPGIVMPTTPDGVLITPSPDGVKILPGKLLSSTQWRAWITNQVAQFGSQSPSFHYSILVKNQEPHISSEYACHDPTIVVTPEPIGG